MTFSERTAVLAGQAALALGWRPDEFWNTTPAELSGIVAVLVPEGAIPDRAVLAQLMQQFPDAATENHNG